MDAEFQSGKMGEFWNWMVVMAAQRCECTYMVPLNCIFKKSQNDKVYAMYILPQFFLKDKYIWRLEIGRDSIP